MISVLCIQCNEVKPKSDFYLNGDTTHSYQSARSICKWCVSKRVYGPPLPTKTLARRLRVAANTKRTKEVIERYQQGETMAAIAESYGMSGAGAVHYILKSAGVDRRERGRPKKFATS